MSRAGDEMINELASLLNSDTVKTAAKKDEDKKEDKKPCKCGKEDCKCKCEGDAEKCKCKKEDDKKDDKEDKKASLMMGVLQDLVKLASELDDAGAEEASGLVDDAIKGIVDDLQKKKIAEPFDEALGGEEDITESFEEGEPITGDEEGMGTPDRISQEEISDNQMQHDLQAKNFVLGLPSDLKEALKKALNE